MSRFLNTLIGSAGATEEQRLATHRMLSTILLVVIVASSSVAFVDGVIFNRIQTLYGMVPLAVLSILSLVLLQRKVLWPARVIIPLGALISISYVIWMGNGLHDVGITGLGIVVVLAGLTLGANGMVIFGFLTTLAVAIIGIGEMNGLIAYPLGTVAISDIVIISIAVLTGAFLLRLLLNRLQNIISQFQESEQGQRKVNEELTALKESLENRVEERTAELIQRGSELEKANKQIQRRAAQFEALAQVAQSIAFIRDPQDLLPRITSVINQFYSFYHVGIFLVDEFNDYAVFTATNSEGGKRMLARNHRLRIGEEGIVGKVAATGEPRIALDVGKDAVYFGNPDLPDTHSEMALPLKSGGRVIGVLDVQSTEPGAFTSDDVQTLSLLADQVSLAIENARLFENSNRTLSELQMVMRQTTREAWKRLPERQRLLGFRYNAMGATPIRESLKLTESGKGRAKAGSGTAGSYVVPIELRGEVIGNLVVQSPTGLAWNDDQKDLIKAVAERVALSAENARLFDETTQRAERERLVSEITGKIRSHNDPQSMIATAINELRTALGASRVEVVPQKNGDTEGKDAKV